MRPTWQVMVLYTAGTSGDYRTRSRDVCRRILEVMPEGAGGSRLRLMRANATARELRVGRCADHRGHARSEGSRTWTLQVKSVPARALARDRADGAHRDSTRLEPCTRASIGATMKNNPETRDDDVWSKFVREQSY